MTTIASARALASIHRERRGGIVVFAIPSPLVRVQLRGCQNPVHSSRST
jgi:hypothetical protein